MLHKTALATAASVAVVVLAGATAVGANIGILDSGEDEAFGQLSAVSVPSSTVPAVSMAVDGSSAESVPTSTVPVGPEVTTFDVEGIAAVTVSRDGTSLTVVGVEPQPGWTWSVEREDDEVEVELRSATEEVDVYLTVLDGQVRTRVERTALQAPSSGTVPPTGPTGGYDDDDEYEDDEYEDDEYEDDQDEDEDHDEYEGRDDDD
jgi:hypothetical protein